MKFFFLLDPIGKLIPNGVRRMLPFANMPDVFFYAVIRLPHLGFLLVKHLTNCFEN